MVIWRLAMKNWIRKNKPFLLFSFSLAILFTSPYLIKDFLPIGHDTHFHISRIEGLARSFQDGLLIPRVYPYKNLNFGYASPLFYSDFFLILPAILYNLGVSLATSYKLIIFLCAFFSSFSMMKLVERLNKNYWISFLAGTLYLFNNYSINNVYVRGALGEILATCFLPIILIGIFDILFENKKRPYLLAFGFSGLILSHNLSFLLAFFLFSIFTLINTKRLTKEMLLSIAKAMVLSFLLTAWFTLPMLEQLFSQQFYLHIYSQSNLSATALPFTTYFKNTTTFGYGNNMALNVGLFMIFFSPLILFEKRQSPKISFIKQCLLLGYIFIFLTSKIMPWSFFPFFQILQFPWRFLLLASTLLVIPASLSLLYIPKTKTSFIYSLFIFLLLSEGIWHILPVLDRPYGISSKTSYTTFLENSNIDSSDTFYVRAELAGADYLPTGGPDYRKASPCLQLANSTSTLCDFEKKSTSLTFFVDTPGDYVLPLTYYKGYQTFLVNEQGSHLKKITTLKSKQSLVQVNIQESGIYETRYVGTFIQKFSLFLSLITLLTVLIHCIFYKYQKKITLIYKQ